VEDKEQISAKKNCFLLAVEIHQSKILKLYISSALVEGLCPSSLQI
jgi:hypothetical protein